MTPREALKSIHVIAGCNCRQCTATKEAVAYLDGYFENLSVVLFAAIEEETQIGCLSLARRNQLERTAAALKP